MLTVFIGEDIAQVANVPRSRRWRSMVVIERVVVTASLSAGSADGPELVNVEPVRRFWCQTCGAGGTVDE